MFHSVEYNFEDKDMPSKCRVNTKKCSRSEQYTRTEANCEGFCGTFLLGFWRHNIVVYYTFTQHCQSGKQTEYIVYIQT